MPGLKLKVNKILRKLLLILLIIYMEIFFNWFLKFKTPYLRRSDFSYFFSHDSSLSDLLLSIIIFKKIIFLFNEKKKRERHISSIGNFLDLMSCNSIVYQTPNKQRRNMIHVRGRKETDFSWKKFFLFNEINSIRFTLVINLRQVEVVYQHKQLFLLTEIFFYWYIYMTLN